MKSGLSSRSLENDESAWLCLPCCRCVVAKEGSFEAAKAEVQDFLKGVKGKAGGDPKLGKDREDATELVCIHFIQMPDGRIQGTQL
jgi:hypothetical protein